MPEQTRIVETVKSDHRQYSRDRRGRGRSDQHVSGTLVNTIKGTGAVGAALTGTVSDVLRGATGNGQAGADIRDAAKGASSG